MDENSENNKNEVETASTTTEPTKKSKKKHKKNKKANANAAQVENGNLEEEKSNVEQKTEDSQNDASTTANLDNYRMDVLQKLKGFQELKLDELIKPPKQQQDAFQKTFKFWCTQPVPQLGETINDINEPIEPNKPASEIRQDPYTLPDGFQWDTLEIDNSQVLKELYTLLNENYVEDDDAMFRFDYQPEFLKWALQPPNWLKEWHVGVRVVKSGRLIAFISAIPAEISIYKKKQKMVEINFLCVHKKLRSKRLAPVLIREITRRVNLTGIFQACYTAGVVLPKPVTTCRYWHRSLNPKKLIEVNFSCLSRNMTMQRTIKLYKLPDQPKTKGFRKIEPKDFSKAHKLLMDYLVKYDLAPVFTEKEFEHWFSPQNNIIECFVVENEGKITDMVSYYALPSTVMHHPTHRQIKAAYSFYNVATKTPLEELIYDALVSARNLNFDVFNALDLMENKNFLTNLKFGIGDGNLQYYVYNWRCPNMIPEKVGLILL